MSAQDAPPSSSREVKGAGGANNLGLRVASAALLAPIAIAAAYLGSWPFALFWTIAALIVLWEWIKLVAGPGHLLMFSSCASAIVFAAGVELRDRPVAALLLVGLGIFASLIFAPPLRRVWVACGIGYAGWMVLAPLFLRVDQNFGMQAIFLLFAVVWTTDVLAYFAGRALGGPKLCPAISPKKTWSGAVAGAVGGMIVAVALVHVFETFDLGAFNARTWAILGLLLSIVSQAGDLLESWIKRRFGAKDASTLIPGHGGVMDRLDGFWAAALAGCIIGLVRGGFHNAGFGLLAW